MQSDTRKDARLVLTATKRERSRGKKEKELEQRKSNKSKGKRGKIAQLTFWWFGDPRKDGDLCKNAEIYNYLAKLNNSNPKFGDTFDHFMKMQEWFSEGRELRQARNHYNTAKGHVVELLEVVKTAFTISIQTS